MPSEKKEKPQEVKTEEKKEKNNLFRKYWWILLVLVAIAALAGGGYYYMQYQQTQLVLKNPTLAAETQTQELINRVGQLMELPKNEQPTIATVSDVTKLKDQPFFAHAENGFKVLIYTKAKKAILYDPVKNKIVDIAPVNLGAAVPQDPSITPAPVRVSILNGTTTAGLTATTEQKLQAKFANITVVNRGNAQKHTYTKTTVVDLSGGVQAALAEQIAQSLGGQIGKLPSGEQTPQDVDVLVILGK